jgi:hydrogenase maturation protease
MTDPVRQVANAVLYEGYLLWPYRRSAVKNTRRWTFGGVYPRGHSRRHADDRCEMRTECLVRGDEGARVDVSVRFLHVVRRQVEVNGQPVDETTVGGERHLSWEEATEREMGGTTGERIPVAVAPGSEREELGGGAAIVRSWQALEGVVEISSRRLGDGLRRVAVRIANDTPFAGGTREQALERTFCSAHTVLRTGGAEFVSLTDPPEALRAEAEACSNEGTWPVLVEDRHTLLSSPIILEDFPRIAPESPGDLFDGGEIDQLLVLNILSLTDEEKAEMRASDPRAREILDRTESLTPEQLMRLHGRFTDLRQVPR